jgi:predicted adenylyl cyclase CyaB
MPRNIEIKARIDSVAELLPQARALADGPEVTIAQDDTFFAARHGRLKLREFADGGAELIHYQRPDSAEAKASDYVRVPVPAPAALREALARALGVQGRVRKQRLLLMVGATRIHLDEVDGLGAFIELEVVLGEGQSDAAGVETAQALMRALGLASAPRLAGAYLDLLAAANAASPARRATSHTDGD